MEFPLKMMKRYGDLSKQVSEGCVLGSKNELGKSALHV